VADFCWTGGIVGGADGTITFTVNGQVNADVHAPRTGICVLIRGGIAGG
jgi:hypothetical protein